eukprot:CAMPEP_0173067348 /NCGR_PEP_ID=MMETSP1102-20130122/6756_1 /TAXON_ID=49646 /ORGANISM="Geminigera sp., Strain Caron Lab Isolate" /LENGTH=57 /DNA_ID=CAMNT_0013934985 /DNA_START=381 /DNA_END=551 /DNA_ORIENTATION=+
MSKESATSCIAATLLLSLGGAASEASTRPRAHITATPLQPVLLKALRRARSANAPSA